jgi:isopenicillin N synthase-like dioxygenase
MAPPPIPAIDITPFADPTSSPEARAATAAALNAAAEDVGFFHLRCGARLADAAARLLQRCQEFHALDAVAKDAVSQERSPSRRGFNASWLTGRGSCAADDPEDPPDPKEVFMLGAEGSASPMHGPNQWPAEDVLPGWRASVERDRAVMLGAARTLVAALASALGEPAGTFDEAMREPASVMIMLRYDPARLAAGSKVGCIA